MDCLSVTDSSCDLRKACVCSRSECLLLGAVHLLHHLQDRPASFGSNHGHVYSLPDNFQSIDPVGSSYHASWPSLWSRVQLLSLVGVSPVLSTLLASLSQKHIHQSEMGWGFLAEAGPLTPLHSLTIAPHFEKGNSRLLAGAGGSFIPHLWFLWSFSKNTGGEEVCVQGHAGLPLAEETGPAGSRLPQSPQAFSKFSCCDWHCSGSGAPGRPCGFGSVGFRGHAPYLGSNSLAPGGDTDTLGLQQTSRAHSSAWSPVVCPSNSLCLEWFLVISFQRPVLRASLAFVLFPRILGHCFTGSSLWWFHLQFMSYKNMSCSSFPSPPKHYVPRARPSPAITPFHFIRSKQLTDDWRLIQS